MNGMGPPNGLTCACAAAASIAIAEVMTINLITAVPPLNRTIRTIFLGLFITSKPTGEDSGVTARINMTALQHYGDALLNPRFPGPAPVLAHDKLNWRSKAVSFSGRLAKRSGARKEFKSQGRQSSGSAPV